MIILAIDTAANLCAASVHHTKAGELGRSVRDLGKGHAEHLMDVIDEALGYAGKVYSDLGAVAVSIGPGSFTGIRVGVSAARGLALALDVSAIGVTTLEALAFEARQAHSGRRILAALDGRRGDVYAALYAANGDELKAPDALTIEAVRALASEHEAVVVGSAVDALNEAGAAFEIAGRHATADIACYAMLAATKPPTSTRPTPLYLRAADAKVQEGFAIDRQAIAQ